MRSEEEEEEKEEEDDNMVWKEEGDICWAGEGRREGSAEGRPMPMSSFFTFTRKRGREGEVDVESL